MRSPRICAVCGQVARFITGMGVGGLGIVSWVSALPHVDAIPPMRHAAYITCSQSPSPAQVLASESWGKSYRNAIGCIMHTPFALGLALFAGPLTQPPRSLGPASCVQP